MTRDLPGDLLGWMAHFVEGLSEPKREEQEWPQSQNEG